MKTIENVDRTAPPSAGWQILVAAAAVWWIAILAAPVFDVSAIYSMFSIICHQMADRSWHLAGHVLPVCIRCTSIYAGFALALVTRLPPHTGFLRIALAGMALEFVVARLGLDLEPLRALSGLGVGLASAAFVTAGVEQMRRRLWYRLRTRKASALEGAR